MGEENGQNVMPESAGADNVWTRRRWEDIRARTSAAPGRANGTDYGKISYVLVGEPVFGEMIVHLQEEEEQQQMVEVLDRREFDDKRSDGDIVVERYISGNW